MSDTGSQQPRPAYCEEFNEEAQASLPETKQSANIAAKRSKPDLPRSKTVRDEFSDSGYSSQTHGTLNSSLDSKIEADQPNALEHAVVSHGEPISEKKPSSNGAQSAEKDNAKGIDPKSRRDVGARRKDCLCEKCIGAHRNTAPIDPHQPSTKYFFGHTRKRTPAPPSPELKRAPPPDAMPLRDHVRPRAATYSRARPMSFHAGAMTDPMLMAQPAYVVERPAARQAIYPFPPPSYPPPQPSYFHPVPPQPPPQEYFAPMPLPYEVQPQAPNQPRPRPRQWTSERMPARPQSMFYVSPPTLEYAEPTYQPIEQPIQHLERKLSRRDRRTSLRTTPMVPDEDSKKMPPPPPPPPRLDTRSRQEQRPAIRHAATTSAYQEVRRRETGYDSAEAQVSSRDLKKASFDDGVRSRRPSLARPSKNSEEKVVSFGAIEREMGRMDIEPGSTKSRRRSSVYNNETLEEKEDSVEAYQQSKGTLRSPAFTPSHDDVLRLVRKKTNTDSDTGSRVSAHSRGSRGSREGSDVKARKSIDRRPSTDVNARNENDRFALRFNPEGINVKMQGGIEGRAINLRKSKDGDGDIELSIESRAGIESSRGRTVGSRPTIREKSRKRYSYMEGHGTVREMDDMRLETATRPASIARVKSREEDGPRIIGEKIVTTTRSRRSSRYAYDGRDRMI